MDCFIIRVYRHITHADGEPDEIAGLVERVGRQDNGRPFTSYSSLVNTLRDEFSTGTSGAVNAAGAGAGGMQLVQATKHR